MLPNNQIWRKNLSKKSTTNHPLSYTCTYSYRRTLRGVDIGPSIIVMTGVIAATSSIIVAVSHVIAPPATFIFLSWSNCIFAPIWNTISTLKRSFHIMTKMQSQQKSYFKSLYVPALLRCCYCCCQLEGVVAVPFCGPEATKCRTRVGWSRMSPSSLSQNCLKHYYWSNGLGRKSSKAKFMSV